jgi:hypothetical protein
LAVVGIVSVATVSALLIVAALASAQGPSSCSRNQAGTPIFAEFDMPNGAAFWSHFPNAGKAPELVAMPGPVHVVAFVGTHHGVPVVSYALGATQAPVFQNVVCVIAPDGHETYYAEIPFTGFTP